MKEDPEISRALLEANPHIAVLMFLFGMLVILIFTAFLSLWGSTLVRWYHGSTVLTIERWKPRSWGLIDVVLVLGAAFVGQAVLIPVWARLSGADLRKMLETDSISLSVMAVGSASYLVAMVLGILWLLIRYQIDFRHIGLSLRRLLPNVGLGLAAAAMSLPIVAMVSMAVSEGLKADYDHPLINELKKEGNVSAYLLAVFCAVLVAPLVEEFFFRVLLQGWLESVPWSWRGWWWLLGANPSQTSSLLSETSDLPKLGQPESVEPPLLSATNEPSLGLKPTLATGEIGEIALSNPYDSYETSGSSSGSSSAGEAHGATIPEAKPPLWPSFVVGTLFGLAHFDYGLSFIPLIMLGIVLGLLYRAKHSIWPCFVLHFALNSISMASLGLALLVESAK